jgi:phosphorylase kinase alpha/beta subunit
MGFWDKLAFDKLRERKKAEHYLKKAMPLVTPRGAVPELYFSNSPKFDENAPLGWAESLFIVALYEFNKKYRLGR